MFRMGLAALSVLTLLGRPAQVSPNSNSEASPPGDQSAPGEMHERLKLLVGAWDQLIEIRPQPDANLLTGTALSKNSLIYGGRFLKVSGEVEFLGRRGEGLIYVGHDNARGRYTFYNISSVSTGATYAEGSFDEANQRFTFHGENRDPVSGRQRRFRIEITVVDEDHFTQENFFQLPGKDLEFRGVRVENTRRKE